MNRKVFTKLGYEPSKGVRPVGVSNTVPRLSLSVSELVKRFTLTTLQEMEKKSLLTYDFGPDVTEDEFSLLERLDLSASSCIDITDVAQLRELAEAQIAEYRDKAEKQYQVNMEAAKQREGEAKEAVIQEAMARLKAEGVKIE